MGYGERYVDGVRLVYSTEPRDYPPVPPSWDERALVQLNAELLREVGKDAAVLEMEWMLLANGFVRASGEAGCYDADGSFIFEVVNKEQR